jgi:hypothetical protein
LIYRPRKKDSDGNRIDEEFNFQDNLGASDIELSDFCQCLKFTPSEEFNDHRKKVIEELAEALGVSLTEAESYTYPSALTAITALCVSASVTARTTTRQFFLQSIKPKVSLYSAWAFREEGENAYCQRIRSQHFSSLNTAVLDRFFIIKLPDQDDISDAFGLVRHIIERWSSKKLKRRPPSECMAPYIYFPEMSSEELIKLKSYLIKDNLTIIDGYAFQGASFCHNHLTTPQTPARPIAARFVADEEQLQIAIQKAKLSKLVIQLHTGNQLRLDESIRQISIPIKNASMAQKIV